MNLEEYEQILPNIEAYGLTWYVPNRTCAWRVQTLMEKEPDTVAWIGGMEPGGTFFDVGANIGQYSMLAAKKGLRVHAFEPESQNFAVMCKNFALNKFEMEADLWPIAVSDSSKLATFYTQQMMAGGSCNSFDAAVDFHLKPKEYPLTQGAWGMSLDNFCYQVGYSPDYVKIDVDGLEHLVVMGASWTLGKVKSVLVETNTHLKEHLLIEGMMESAGLYPDEETAEKARRKEGAFEGIGNVIYYRREA